MTTENAANSAASVDEIQKGWHDLKSRVGTLEAERDALEQDNKALRFLLERVIEHRGKSHGELVLILTGLVSKLPMNDVGAIVAKLVEHNSHVNETCAVLVKGKADAALPQPMVLKALEDTKRELEAALKPAIEELIQLEAPFEKDLLQSLIAQPDLFFSPKVVRANRCFIKGLVPRERILREFGEPALIFFNDMTTDKKVNPNPKPEEIAFAFKSDFETLFQQNPSLIADKRNDLQTLYQRVQASKASPQKAHAQKNAFLRMSFLVELLHYYQNQNTEAPDVVFAQRLPALTEQLVVTGPQDKLDEKYIVQAETLLAYVVNPDYRQAVINNIGKSGGAGKTLKYVLLLRSEKLPQPDEVIGEFIKHLVPNKKAPSSEELTASLRLIKPDRQRLILFALMDSDRLPKDQSVTLAKAVGAQIGLAGLEAPKREPENVPPETERQMAWEKIKEMIASRREPTAVAAAVRERLHAKYDADEMKQSWVTLTEADPISLIRVFCHLPYLADGRTDPVARAVMETYVTRLTHEKYAATYQKVISSLRNMFRANPSSPTLLNFVALVKWLDQEAANKISADIGMPVAA
jgi:hypothetical protein